MHDDDDDDDDDGYGERDDHDKHHGRCASNRLFHVFDLHWPSPESRGVWCKLRRLKQTI